MDILLIRHAIAVERSHELPDADRPLAPRGVRRFTQQVEGMAQIELVIDRVFHSPWLRAVQTADLLAPLVRGDRSETALLAREPCRELISLAVREANSTRVAFVGHEPWMGELLSLLALGSVDDGGQFPFKKGGVAWLRGVPEPGGMELRALFPPKALRALAPA